MEHLIPRNLLAVSWAMPPIVMPRALQVSRLLQALARQGWGITVLAAPPSASALATAPVDDALAREFAETCSSVYVADSALLNTCLQWMGRRPDAWERLVAFKANQIISRGNIDALVTFAQPFKDHMAGLRIHRRHPHLPWIAHFSDPWVDNPLIPLVPWHERQGERMTVEQADALIFTTERTRAMVLRRYSHLPPERCHVLPHCFDDTALPDAPPADDMGAGLHLVHTGNLYEARMPFGLLFALANLRKEGIQDIFLHFIGHAQPLFRNLSKSLGLDDQVRYEESRSPRACLRECRRADVLLSCDAPAEESVFLPSKLVDYLAARRPLLCITPGQSSSNDFLREIGGLSVAPEDVSGMVRLLLDLRRQKQSGALAALIPPEEAARRYLPECAALHFAAIVEQLARGGRQDA